MKTSNAGPGLEILVSAQDEAPAALEVIVPMLANLCGTVARQVGLYTRLFAGPGVGTPRHTTAVSPRP